ncbi:drug/metabolite transporter (DMT)-like permease [Desulfobaculum xiamenense]|uniref:Drug/metabolite transporter (DMT)-like permease n=1 Tax=Desulfobaculum xiamenense TaxID=995050 RepID=A0A846QT38_9BACT|nr:DMT family transporter [Desulfobaculum xiamenense]NJB67809.1 drug/metabolite transporter (DMT)-like permease [Desulfobaculum xiamenense]
MGSSESQAAPGRGISKGVLCVAAGTVFFSMSSVLVKMAGQRLPFMELVLGRSVFGLVLCWWLMRRSGVPELGHNRRLLFLRGVLGFGGLAASFYAITHMPLADAIVLFYSNPVFAVAISLFFLGERLDARAVACIPLCLAGVMLVTRPPIIFGASGTDVAGLAYGVALFAAVSSAGAYTTMHHLGRSEHPLVIVLYLYIVSIPISLVASIPGWVAPTWTEWAMLAGIGTLTQVGQMLLTRGLAMESTGTATATGCLQVVFTALWGMLFFDEYPDALALAGAGCIVASTLVLSGTIRLWRRA